jgi:FAD/FMN-containing dehydrogenase
LTFTITPFNLRLPFTPAAVAVPTTLAQVQDAVKCGVQAGLKMNPKSGGHSYAAHSLGGEDGHFMIDLEYWDTVVVDNAARVAAIGPAGGLGNIAQSLYAQGKRAFSHGTCPGQENYRINWIPR